MKKIYLDFAATTPVDDRVFEAMKPYFSQKYGNPSSIYNLGREARVAIEQAREKIARALGAEAKEIIFTSCATEANNLALKGLIEKLNTKAHLIVSPIEHHAVLDTVKHLEKQGVEVFWLKVDKDGLVDPHQIERLVRDNTILVSVMYGNNEVGTIEPIEAIGKLLQKINQSRIKSLKSKIYFHTDAVQAFQYLDCDVNRLGVDLLSLSAHKFYGPKGVGVLYARKGTPLARQQDGGGQESNLRAGTENVAGIVGMGKAVELARSEKWEERSEKIGELRDKLIVGVLKNVSGAVLTGHPQKRLPHIASFVISGAEGESILLLLDEYGISASSGSACTTGSLDPSHVLTAMGYKPEETHGSLRFSLGQQTSLEDINFVIKVLPGIVAKLRRMAPKI